MRLAGIAGRWGTPSGFTSTFFFMLTDTRDFSKGSHGLSARTWESRKGPSENGAAF
jgi:hypothetical protein